MTKTPHTYQGQPDRDWFFADHQAVPPATADENNRLNALITEENIRQAVKEFTYDELVIEYVSEVINKEEKEKREVEYRKAGLYFYFRLWSNLYVEKNRQNALITEENIRQAFRLAVATKANFWLSNHHTGQGVGATIYILKAYNALYANPRKN